VKFPSLFTPAQIGVLADLHERDSRERREGIREESSLKALAPSVAQFLYLLIVQKSARTIVEFGTLTRLLNDSPGCGSRQNRRPRLLGGRDPREDSIGKR